MNQNILQIPLDKNLKYLGPFHTEFKEGNELTLDWEVISTPLIEGVTLAVYNREIASVLFNDADIEFLWNQDTRDLIANFENLSIFEFFSAMIQNNSKL